MKKHLPMLFVAAVSLACAHARGADGLKGADSILKPLNAAADATRARPDTRDTEEKIRRDIMAFRKAAPTMPPEVAAKAWVALAVRFVDYDLSFGEMDYASKQEEPFSFNLMAVSLPPPASWDEIAREVEAAPMPAAPGGEAVIRMLALKLFAQRLAGNADGVKKYLTGIDADFQSLSDYFTDEKTDLDNLHEFLRLESNPGADELDSYNDSLKGGMEKTGDAPGSFTVGDLVSMGGSESALASLRNSVVAYVILEIGHGQNGETEKLAREAALELVRPMKVPQWKLTHSVDAVQLYEALLKKFPPPENGTEDPNGGYEFVDDKWRPVLNMEYLQGLIQAGRLDDATAYALQYKGVAPRYYYTPYADDMDDGVNLPAYVDFFHDLLAKNPDLPYWDFYLSAAPLAGRRGQMKALLEATSRRADIPDAWKQPLEYYFADALEAEGKIDEAAAIYRKDTTGFGKAHLDYVGKLLGRKDLQPEPTAATPQDQQPASSPQDASAIAKTAADLASNGHAAEAEAMIEQGLKNAKSFVSKRELTWTLIEVYHFANRPADVLKVLDEGRYLGVANVADMIPARGRDDYYGYYIAAAFADMGRKDVAEKILKAVLSGETDCDPGYELLAKIAPRKDALALLDAIAQRDHYEPRALTWKAKVLLDGGELDEAEKAARNAIAIDPLDSPASRSPALSPYSVLADIRQARGDQKEADALRGIVTGLSECDHADNLADTGLLTNAMRAYREALAHFDNSFRIHFRMGICLEHFGDRAAAEEQFRLAYECATPRFNNLEPANGSYWEATLFSTRLSRDVADNVLPELVKQHPGLAQFHFLLARLRYDETRYSDALPEARAAAKLDPAHLDVWLTLYYLCQNLYLPAADSDAIRIEFLRLDPSQRRFPMAVNRVVDLKSLWGPVEASWKLQPRSNQQIIYPLPVSALEAKKELADAEKETYIPPADPLTDNPLSWGHAKKINYDPGDPRRVITANDFISNLIGLLDIARYNLRPGYNSSR